VSGWVQLPGKSGRFILSYQSMDKSGPYNMELCGHFALTFS